MCLKELLYDNITSNSQNNHVSEEGCYMIASEFASRTNMYLMMAVIWEHIGFQNNNTEEQLRQPTFG